MTKRRFIRNWEPSVEYGNPLREDFTRDLNGLIDDIVLFERRRAYRLYKSLGLLSEATLEIVFREEE